LIPTRLSAESTPAISVAGARYPPPSELKAIYATNPLKVFQGTVTIDLDLKVSPGATSGEHVLPLRLSYQACTEHECLPPAEVRAEVRLRVE
jgi:hypothetical protein